MATAPVAVVHLALESYGVTPFRAFVESYRRHPAGIDHELVIALKGFTDLDEASDFAREVDGLGADLVLVPDEGFDLGTYFHVARMRPRTAYLFTNSRTSIWADGYLANLSHALASPGVGLVGATGSLQSLASHYRWSRSRPGWPDWCWRLISEARSLLALRHYPPFPNPHLRSNAMLIRHDVLTRLAHPEFRTKADCMRFESGWTGITRQIEAMGLEVRLVESTGRSLAPHEWPTADVFWQGGQTALMIADNQTELYRQAGPPARAVLHDYAWTEPPPLFSAAGRIRAGSRG